MEHKIPPFIRNIDAAELLEIFIISAVASIIIIRVYLELANYPTIGTGGLHIAHMLWGGFLMLIAIGFQLLFLDRKSLYITAILGGIGFGAFIDELGKFVTSDNNYFFEPTFALIYIIFIFIFLVYRWVLVRVPLYPTEYFVNYLNLLPEVVTHDIDTKQKAQLREYLIKADLDLEIKEALATIVDRVDVNDDSNDGLYIKTKHWLADKYQLIVSQPWFPPIVIVLFTLRGLWFVGVSLLYLVQLSFLGVFSIFSTNTPPSPIQLNGFFDIGGFLITLLVNAFLVLGIYFLRRNYLRGLVWLQRSTLISLLLGQFFAFYQDQLIAVVGVVTDLLILNILGYMITQEEAPLNDQK